MLNGKSRIKCLLFSCMLAVIACLTSCIDLEPFYTEPDETITTSLQVRQEYLPFTNSGVLGIYPEGSPVARHGKLKIVGTQLCDEYGNPVQLRGLYLRGLNYEAKFINYKAISYLSKNWKMDVLRVPLWPAGGHWGSGTGSVIEPGYLDNPALENYIKDAVRITEECGIYCIIDWQILFDGDPNLHKTNAYDFFKRMAFLYGAKKQVIYEICNEPNHVKWNSSIKPYAEYIIPAIRAGDSNALIIVGTEFWSIDQHHASANPLKYENIMYTSHFYTGEPLSMTNRISSALTNIAIFCTEWGACISGLNPSTPLDLNNARLWINFLNSKNISWCNYSLSDVPWETTSFLINGTKTDGGWGEADLTRSGKFVRDLMTNRSTYPGYAFP